MNRQKSLALSDVSLPLSVLTLLPDAPATLAVSASAVDTQGASWSGSASYPNVINRLTSATLTLQSGQAGNVDLGSSNDLGDAGVRPHVWKMVASTGPSGRNSARMVYDSQRKVMVLFGGVTASGDVNETWEWDGSSWKPRPSMHAPSPRHGYAMSYDEARQLTFLFSGAVMGGGPTTDGSVWKWDGTDWAAITTNLPPAPRASSLMVYDSMRHVSVLFGGETAGNVESAETWEFDGANWNQPTLQAPSPPSKHAFAMAYDAAHARVVLFGGAGPVATTWSYDGTAWTERVLQFSPPARRAAAMAYDSQRGVLMLFGGNHKTNSPGRLTYGDTWEWDGVSSSWVEVETTGPPARAAATVAFDPVRGEVLLFGGNPDASSPFGDTWSR